jgi:hypothetical protein
MLGSKHRQMPDEKEIGKIEIGAIRDIRVGWPLLTVETEANEVARITTERVLPWLVRWVCGACTRDFCTALAALVGP